jgi:hypothetical protein
MNFINENANIFFFVTTIFVIVLIILFTVLLLAAIKLYKFVVKVVKQGDVILEDVKTNEFVKKGTSILLPILLPIFSFFMKNKRKNKK